jgi:hypothetical protein
MKKTTTLAAVFMLTALAAWSAVPQLISYQGVLTDGAGTAVPDNTYNITFSLYDVSSGGTALWTETQSVSVSGGIFSINLGTQNSLTLTFDTAYWLGVSVDGGAELVPRRILTTSPYSMRARTVDDGAVVKSLNGLTDDVTVAAGTNVTIVQNNDTLIVSAAGGAGGDLDWTIAGNNMYSGVPGNVGIGVGNPSRKLTIDGGGLLVYDDAGEAITLNSDLVEIASSSTGQTAYAFDYNQGDEYHMFASGGSNKLIVSSDVVAVSGGQRNLGTTEGDFRIGDDTNRLKFGVATSGIFAGTAGIRAQGTNAILALGAGSYEPFMISQNGSASMWFYEANSTFDFYESGGTDPVVSVSSTDGGGKLEVSGVQGTIRIEPDAPDADDAVALFANSISSQEAIAEAGVAFNQWGVAVSIGPGSVGTVLSRSLTTPDDPWTHGHVLAIATATVYFYHMNGTQSWVDLEVSDTEGSFPFGVVSSVSLPADAPSGMYYFPMTTHAVFEITTPGDNTFYLLAQPAGDLSAFILGPKLTLVYLPTAYGSVTPIQTAGVGGEVGQRGSMSAADIAAEQAEARAFHQARVDRELAAIRDELEAVKAQLNERK